MPYCVYMHISPNDKVYIGVTCKKPKDRWRNGNGYKNNEFFYRAIQKYGWDCFQHLILFEGLTKEDAYKKERNLIYKYSSMDRRFGYNHHPGGCGANEGHFTSEETREKRSKSMRGKFVGIYVGEKSPKAKKINQYTLNGEYVKTWGSTTDIQRSLAIGYTNIVKCCTNNLLTAGGYIWRYAENPCGVDDIVKRLKTPKKHTDEQKEKIAKSMLGKKHPTISKPIIATNKTTGEVRFYESISDTQKDGLCPQNVSKCLNPKYPYRKSLKGFTFEYAEDKRLNERIKALENKAS